MKKSNKLSLLLVPLLVVLSLYISGYITQFIRNYNEWKLEYGLASGVSPKLPSGDFMTCVKATFSSDGLNGIMIIGIIIVLIIFFQIFVHLWTSFFCPFNCLLKFPFIDNHVVTRKEDFWDFPAFVFARACVNRR